MKMFRSILLTGVALAVLGALVSGCSEDTASTPVAVTTPRLDDVELPAAVAGQFYSQTLTPSGGSRPYTWTYDAQTFPPGMIATTTGDEITFAGTPTTPGEYSFSVTVTDEASASDEADITVMVIDAVDISGSWILNLVVTRALGVCLGEAGDTSSVAVEITQTPAAGAGNFDVTLTGALGDSATQFTGTLTSSSAMTLSGMYPEDGGTTTSTLDLTIYSNDELRGLESWSWDGPDGECPSGLTSIRARRP